MPTYSWINEQTGYVIEIVAPEKDKDVLPANIDELTDLRGPWRRLNVIQEIRSDKVRKREE